MKILIIILICFQSINSQDISKCYNHQTCDKCLISDFACSWCSDREYSMQKSRCMTSTDLIAAGCRHEYLQINSYTKIELTENKSLRDYSSSSMEAVQIQPQRAKLKLRKMQTQTITMKYKPAKNYPLDLYYLMDLTVTMNDDKHTLSNMGEHLAIALQNLTDNFRLGFGSFADKPTMPFILLGRENNPCSPMHQTCRPSYGFWHRLSLSRNISDFISQVSLNDITANLDNLEGGLDAVMQIAVCKSEIGWVENARKMILFASDGGIHFAGDGLLGGIVKKSDKKCHISEDGQYLSSLEFDYPSLEEIYWVLIQKKINLIFAVERSVKDLYDKLHDLTKEMTSVGVLENDSSNILELIKTGYKDFVRKAQFHDNAPEYISIKYKTKCGELYPKLQDLSHCENIEIGNEYEFLIEITVLDYPSKDEQYKNIIKIEESSLSSEGLELDIEIEKPCLCLETEIGEKNSQMCNQHGEMKCGACYCESGWVGRTCQCDLQDYSTSKDLENLCRTPVINASMEEDKINPICSKRGDCICGECNCILGFTGKYCNCLECPRKNNKECGGSEHAKCNCGVCKCNSGWTGDFCDCTLFTNSCMAPNNKICSNRGKCKCGKCDCNRNMYGEFCQLSSDQSDSLCSYYAPCVKCMILIKDGNQCSEISTFCSSSNGSTFNAEYFDDIPDTHQKCILRIIKDDGTHCEHTFGYRVDEVYKNHIRILYNKCDLILLPYLVYICLGILLFILFFGIIIIVCVKTIIVLKDRREYASFMEEKEKHTMYVYESPLYKSPITTYKIPKMNNSENKL